MGTFVHISASGPSSETVEPAIENAFRAVEQVERLMSFHDSQSELFRINREARIQPQTVHPWTYAVLRRALWIATLSDGLFDISVAPLLVEAGLLPRTQGSASASGNGQSLELLPHNQIYFTQPMLLDLGGIAKGFAVDQAIHAYDAAAAARRSSTLVATCFVLAERLIRFICAAAPAPCKWRYCVVAPSPPRARTKVFPINSRSRSAASSIRGNAAPGTAKAASWSPRAVA